MKILEPVAILIARCKHQFGTRLNARTKGWSRTQQKVFLMLFVAVVAGVSILQLYHDDNHFMLHNTPQPDPMIDQSAPNSKRSLSPQDSHYLKLFHQRLEQLQSTAAGRDSLLEFVRQRPGFIDSVLRWESEMKHQHK